MNTLNLSENISKLRRQKGFTQEELANFLGVTKASVSKWETKQSLPDILLLPQLATFFDVTVDELLGYELQLSKEQIRNLYHKLASDFGKLPFEEVIASCEHFIKKYYSCYPFLLQMVVLYINHFMLAQNQKRQEQLLQYASALCDHIEKNCEVISICNDSIVLKANINLILQKPQEVIDVMEEINSPYSFISTADTLLINAYQMAGKSEKADSKVQINMYMHLISFVQNTIFYLRLHNREIERCKIIIERTNALIKLFDFENLHPNTSFMFYYEVALTFCIQNNTEEALNYLTHFVDLFCHSIKQEDFMLHSDPYFPLLDTWFDDLDLGRGAPRDKHIILNSAIESLHHPVLSILEPNKQFKLLEEKIMEELYANN